ncbi:hypothetical protein NC99_30360 [Sunxiuqinia dokdonensis]|uniref:Uncharacterized protein n=1 Tax=Sunxiuqinia dokdonensis TaxID=1409788 RepID=A0A0L8V6Q3_9BACT|nr:hypothetical protein NC99_30360 [Sunxiuqinia dokdonensis]
MQASFLPPIFQFQYGAIGGDQTEYEKAGFYLFQFQYGAIGGLTVENLPASVHISIPVWCDWWSRAEKHRRIKTEISIPVWCDWWRITAGANKGKAHFNSSMVRLVEIAKCYNPKQYLNISIPVWCDWWPFDDSKK